MLAYKLQMPVNHPEKSAQNSEHAESLKSIKWLKYSASVIIVIFATEVASVGRLGYNKQLASTL
jgi:hypothetical protein